MRKNKERDGTLQTPTCDKTAEARWAAHGKKAGAEKVMKPQPTDKETNGGQ